MEWFKNASEFEWDPGNKDKNFAKHRVTNEECEEAFFDPHKRFRSVPSEWGEERHLLVAKTKAGRLLFIVFTLRRSKIRVIPARDLNRRERHLYEKES
ncbi:MAG: BrnT family toxin [Candidatus Omnitrophica bacterium]|nr:BrnT family toxin [Candidatus Omnitrophota bacterium]